MIVNMNENTIFIFIKVCLYLQQPSFQTYGSESNCYYNTYYKRIQISIQVIIGTGSGIL